MLGGGGGGDGGGERETTSLPPQLQSITTPLPPFLKAAGLQTVKVQSDCSPRAWQLTGHYALTIQNCDLIKYADVPRQVSVLFQLKTWLQTRFVQQTSAAQ